MEDSTLKIFVGLDIASVRGVHGNPQLFGVPPRSSLHTRTNYLARTLARTQLFIRVYQ